MVDMKTSSVSPLILAMRASGPSLLVAAMRWSDPRYRDTQDRKARARAALKGNCDNPIHKARAMNRRSFLSSLALAAFAAPAIVRAAQSPRWVKREARFGLLGFIPKQDIVTCLTTDTYRTMLTFESPEMVRNRSKSSVMTIVKEAHRIDGGQRIPVRNLQIDDCGWKQVARKHWTTTNRRVRWEELVS